MVAIFLVLKKPTPVVVQVPAATVAAPAQSSGQPMEQREPAAQQASPVSSGNYAAAPAQTQTASQNQPAVASSPQPKAQPQFGSDGISALLQAAQSAGGGELSPDSEVGDGEPNIKDQHVTYEGDVGARTVSHRDRGKRRVGDHLRPHGFKRWIRDVRTYGI